MSPPRCAPSALPWHRRQPARHRFIRIDVTTWVDIAHEEQRRSDLMVRDPPAFSNSKAMQDVFDVQRDYVALVRTACALLAPGSELYVSTNLRTFAIDASRARDPGCAEVTRETRAEDFREPRVHGPFGFRSAG